MLDAIAAHVEFVQGDHIFGEVVPNAVVDPEFPIDGLRGGQQVDAQLLLFEAWILWERVPNDGISDRAQSCH